MKGMRYYNSIWYKITKPFKRLWFRKLLKEDRMIYVDYRHRGIGKTFMLIDRAIEIGAPILVGNITALKNIKRNGNPVEVILVKKGECIPYARRTFKNGVLIDESLNPRCIVEMRAKGVEVRGGFIGDYGASLEGEPFDF